MRLFSTVACLTTLAALLATGAMGQPIPVEGTEMVETEYGVAFPREITWEKDGSRMVLVPGGTFVQGLAPAKGGASNEGPERRVTLSTFYIDKFEISNEQYLKFSKEASGELPRPTGDSKLLTPDRPVTAIPWNAASRYAEWAGKQLPTEAMWEYAARGPENKLYITGDQPPTTAQMVWGRGFKGVSEPTTQLFGADLSGFGVANMGGNVSEFTADYYTRDAYTAGDATNPSGPTSSEAKVVRGASFASKADELRLTARAGQSRVYISDFIGFRTVWVPRQLTDADRPTPTPSPVPTIAMDRLEWALRTEVLRLMASDALELPENFKASPSLAQSGYDSVQYVNFTPHRIVVTFVSLDFGKVFKYREPISPMSTRTIELPNGVNLLAWAYSPDAKGEARLLDLGNIRAESKAVVVMGTELISPVVTATGERYTNEDGRMQASQYYGAYTPRWNEIEFYNKLDVETTVVLQDILRDQNKPEPVGEFTVQPGDTLRLNLPPSRYLMSAEYFGALDASSDSLSVMLDDKVARRLVQLQPDSDRKVMVITEEKPGIRLNLIEATRIR